MSDITKRDFNGIAIAFEGKEKVSLTDLWKAAGSPENKQPTQWVRWPQTQEFIKSLAQKLNVCNTHNAIIQAKRGGKTPGTWAHWQLALTYAQMLSPELHMFVNQCFVERVQEENNPELAITRGRERAIRKWKKEGRSDEWIAARIRTINAAKQNNRVLKKHGDDHMVYPMCANAMNRQILGMEAKEYKEVNGLPAKAATRDFLDDIQLAELELSSLVSAKRIEESSIYGNQACANAHETIAGRIHGAVTMRGI